MRTLDPAHQILGWDAGKLQLDYMGSSKSRNTYEEIPDSLSERIMVGKQTKVLYQKHMNADEIWDSLCYLKNMALW